MCNRQARRTASIATSQPDSRKGTTVPSDFQWSRSSLLAILAIVARLVEKTKVDHVPDAVDAKEVGTVDRIAVFLRKDDAVFVGLP